MLVYRTRISEKNARRRRAKILFWYAYVHSLKILIGLEAGGNISKSMHITTVFNDSNAMLHVK